MERMRKIILTLVLVMGAALVFPRLSWSGPSCGQGSTNPDCDCGGGTIIISADGKSASCAGSFKAIDPFKESTRPGTVKLRAGTAFNAGACMEECRGKPPGTCTCLPPDDISGKPPPPTEAKSQVGTIQMPAIPDANQIWATMANSSGNIRIAYQPLGEAGFKECPQIPKTQAIKVYCYPGPTTYQTDQDDYKVWKDEHSVRIAPVDGECHLRVAKLDAYGTNEPYTCLDPTCEKTKLNEPLCSAKVGKNGIQVVLGSGSSYKLTHYETPTNIAVGSKEVIVSTSIHPSPTSPGTAMMLFNLPPGTDDAKIGQLSLTISQQNAEQAKKRPDKITVEGCEQTLADCVGPPGTPECDPQPGQKCP